ncbi:hypothetical protein Droror1_Dr00018779 [Drosera rotundifolia]
MSLQGVKSRDMSLVLSTDAKPRLKWTPELHQRFVEAVNHLGGADRATPKSLMRVMGVPGLTLYHLKSHLQKFRLRKNQLLDTCSDFRQDDDKETLRAVDNFSDQGTSDAADDNQMNGSLQLAEALQMQMEVQRKLHEQIEVQRHLQLRIEAQGKYLQKVLKKAQETLSGYNTSPLAVDHTKEELSKLDSLVSSGYPGSSSSELTEAIASSLEHLGHKPLRDIGHSMENSLATFDSTVKHEKLLKHDSDQQQAMLQLFDQSWINNDIIRSNDMKRNCCSTSSCDKEERPTAKKLSTCREKNRPGLSKLGVLDTFDLNSSQYQIDIDLGSKSIDLNTRD